MQRITDHLSSEDKSKKRIPLSIDRRTLAKRRFRASADDGAEFGFDLAHPLSHGTPFYENESGVYVIDQKPEPVLKIGFPDGETGARYGWLIGNMHFPAAFESDCLIAEDDPAVRQLLDRNRIAYAETVAIFQPAIVAGGHHHH